MANALDKVFRGRFDDFNGTLWFIMIYMAGCGFNFGYDVGNFSGIQGMESFGMKFGEFNEDAGRWALPAWLSSLMTSVPFFGKALGAIVCGWIAERWGRKVAILGLIALSFLGATLQASATTAAQFTIGRTIAFAMTGFTMIVVPIYQAECAPKSVRGMLNSTLQLMVMVGQVVAAVVCLGTKTIKSDAGWQITVSMQLVAPTILLALYFFVPEFPRWLLAKGRVDQATTELKKLYKKATKEEIAQQIGALQLANSNESKGTWAEVFNKENRVRTGVAILAMFGQQVTGQAFISQYNVIFYQQQGFAAQAFTFNLISPCLGVLSLFFTWFLVDAVGRRPLLIIGGTLMSFCLLAVGSIATIPNPTQSAREAMVACFILFGPSYSMSWGPISYVILSEAAASRIKEKTNLLATTISVITTFVTSFTLPYLLHYRYAGLGGKVGFICGAICAIMAMLAYFFIPELKGRSLEEVDQLFASGEALRKFKRVKTQTVEELYGNQKPGSIKDEKEQEEKTLNTRTVERV